MPVLLELLFELPRLTVTDLHRVNVVVGLLELYRPVADVFAYHITGHFKPSTLRRISLTIHFLPCLEEVLRVGESNKAVLGLEINVSVLIHDFELYLYLSTESITYDSGLLERRILVEGV